MRDGETGPYYAAPGNWVADRDRAMDFMLVERAIQANNEQRLGATHVVLAYDAPACNLTFPISNYTTLPYEASPSLPPNQPRLQKPG